MTETSSNGRKEITAAIETGGKALRKRKGDHDDEDRESENAVNSATCIKDGKKTCSCAQLGEALPDAGVGDGPRWRLPEDEAPNGRKGDLEARKRCRILLEQALSSSLHADVRFVFDDESSSLRGHWGMLCGVCKVFETMHACGLQESRTREIRIVGTSQESFRGFLEWLYLGRAGKEMAGADGREVWLLAERYQIDGVKEWLMSVGLDSGNVCAAAHYAIAGDGERREELLKACREKAGWSISLPIIDEGCLRGVSACALREVLEGHRCGGELEGDRAMERFRAVERWAKANGIHGVDDDDVCGLIDDVDLRRVPAEFISKVVRPSGLVSWQHLLDLELQHVGDVCIGDVTMHHIKSLWADRADERHLTDISHMAVYVGSDGSGRVAATELDGGVPWVFIYDVESGEHVMTLGEVAEGDDESSVKFRPADFDEPAGVAFDKLGQLIVCDKFHHQIQVFDPQGGRVHSFGRPGNGDGELQFPSGVAVNHHGDIVMCDTGNYRVQIFGKDGTFISKFGSAGTGAGQFQGIRHLAVGPDGSIVVLDFANPRVQVFSTHGSYMMTIGSKGTERGQFLTPSGVCVGLRGEIIVNDRERGDVQVFSQSGELMQCIGRGGHSCCDITIADGVAVDSLGRLFVGCMNDDRLDIAILGMRIA